VRLRAGARRPLDMRRPLTLALAVFAFVPGCYESLKYGPPTLATVPVAEGARIRPHYHHIHTTYRSGADGRPRDLDIDMIDKIDYGQNTLTYHEVRSLADPNWGTKLAEYDQIAHRCGRASRAETLAYIGIVAGANWAYWSGNFLNEDQNLLRFGVGGGLVGVGLLSYAVGYAFLGGRDCGKANQMAENLHLQYVGGGDIGDPDAIAEIKAVAKDFNKRVCGGRDRDDTADATDR
jgi:hypothetical protein